ncbi:polyphosphate kinase 2 family protein [Streptomyces sp. OF3]|uniref:Polyphosphate kinase 2 family protein n=1 Tax=Streptomyces alkaliterrae TaxID=2213162 RepID=A0A7W3WN07_9ACTN|nr:PPK2 family polyphosphate kinase [Streptomyces alkaliterrae]MBB1255392.1 polyphosphate kinase 2 family protein [Streptomyces alkaliterrae]
MAERARVSRRSRAEAAGGVRVGELLRVPPGSGPRLADVDTRATPGDPPGKRRARAAVAAVGERLAELQERLYAASTAGDRRRVLLVLQGMDTSGKGGTVKHVVARFNPAGCRIRSFKAPTDEELRHPFLWRVERALPAPGEIGVFDRSHYEDVLAARVRGLVPEDVWQARYELINDWERRLVEDGVTLVKVFLHLGYEEQRERLLARLDRPDKHWKFSEGDLDDRVLWPEYQRAYEVALRRCSTPWAPWYLVPADRKWYRDWAVAHLLHETLSDLDPRYPPGDLDLDRARARLSAD